jgi:hypothetical protein
MPSAPRAAPSNIIVAPPSGTLTIDGGIGWGAALALWLNANITAQPIPNNSTTFPVTIPFVFIISPEKASIVPIIETITRSGIR